MKEILKRGAIGLPVGIALGYLITIAISLTAGLSELMPCVPQLTEALGSELRAVVLQTALCALLGAGCAAASLIWEKEHWGLVKQTGIYFLVLSLLMLPIAYATYWMEHSLKGFVTYFGIFLGIFAITWLAQFLVGRGNVRKLNAGLRDNK